MQSLITGQWYGHLPPDVFVNGDPTYNSKVFDVEHIQAVLAFHPTIGLFQIEIVIDRAADRACHICLTHKLISIPG